MIRGSCLCGGVRFEIERAEGPFELCHCSRCRKVSGSAYLTWLGVRREEFRFLHGVDLIKTYERPVTESPPPYDTSFCSPLRLTGAKPIKDRRALVRDTGGLSRR